MKLAIFVLSHLMLGSLAIKVEHEKVLQKGDVFQTCDTNTKVGCGDICCQGVCDTKFVATGKPACYPPSSNIYVKRYLLLSDYFNSFTINKNLLNELSKHKHNKDFFCYTHARYSSKGYLMFIF